METGHLNPPLTRRLPGLAVAGIASLGAGAVHAAAAGVHAEHARLAQLFILTAAAQLGAGLWALVRPARLAAWAVVGVNAIAVGGWLTTRLTGISWIPGLETREAAQFADTACALLGAVAVGAALSACLVGWRPANHARIAMPSLLIAALAVPAMWTGGTHVHSHSDGTAHEHAVDPVTGDTVAHDDHAVDPVTGEAVPHDDHAVDPVTGDTVSHTDHPADPVAAAGWPRPWNPAVGIDLSGVPGVTIDQQLRADQLIKDTLRDLPRWSTTEAALADGYKSIGDAGTGTEHYIKSTLIEDDIMLDPTQPESLVYAVDGDKRTLTGAMFIASARPTDDPEIVDFAGPLMTWHNHGNLCWALIDGVSKVVGITDANGVCANGVNTGGENPMVHVWIAAHECGPFAALEGVGAGQTSVSEEARVDKCSSHDDHGAPAVAPKPYDPTQPIDLSGTPGVTPEQQAAAENLIAITVVRLPQWSDYKVAEAAGFNSIGDGITGVEHFINWDWINDDVVLDPDHPESLVYEPQPDGSKKLVSAMFMLPDSVALEDVPDIGGALMQWHIHDNLCFTKDPNAARLGSVTSPNGTCPPGLVRFLPAAMIHVWIVPHPCGPFAALEGVGAGTIVKGEERLCDTAHGSH